MHQAEQRMEGQSDDKAAQHRDDADREHIRLAPAALQPVPDDRLPDGQRDNRIQDAGRLDDQVGDAHFVRGHHARVETEHQDDQDLGAERADCKYKGVAQQPFVLIHSVTLSQADGMDAVGCAVGQPTGSQPAQNPQQHAGQNISGVMHTGIQAGERDERRRQISQDR